MKVLQVNNLSRYQKQFARDVWNNEYPQTLFHRTDDTFDAYLNSLDDVNHYFIEIDNVTVGWFMDFVRQGDKWFAVIIDRASHGKGLGQRVLQYLKTHNSCLYGWVIAEDSSYVRTDGSPYLSPLAFYLNHGFEICEGETLVTDKINAVKVVWHR